MKKIALLLLVAAMLTAAIPVACYADDPETGTIINPPIPPIPPR
jgi:hypothetical protein